MDLLDTNLLIRFLTNDDEEKAINVEKLLNKSKNKLYLSDVTISETVWVLKSVYKLEKKEIIKKMKLILTLPSITYNKKTIDKSINNYEKYNINWVDSYLTALNQLGKYNNLYSYDESLDSVLGTNRLEPK